jgi:hypothetical protein
MKEDETFRNQWKRLEVITLVVYPRTEMEVSLDEMVKSIVFVS